MLEDKKFQRLPLWAKQEIARLRKEVSELRGELHSVAGNGATSEVAHSTQDMDRYVALPSDENYYFRGRQFSLRNTLCTMPSEIVVKRNKSGTLEIRSTTGGLMVISNASNSIDVISVDLSTRERLNGTI